MSDRIDEGSKTLAKVLLASMLIGVGVVLIHPAFRATLLSMWKGDLSASPIWESNRDYYPMNSQEVEASREYSE